MKTLLRLLITILFSCVPLVGTAFFVNSGATDCPYNLFLGYLWEAGGIYEDGGRFADRIEYLHYRKNYGDDLGKRRASIDEISDKPWYEAGKRVYQESKKISMSSLGTNTIALLVKQEGIVAKAQNQCADEKETYENYKLCKESSGTELLDMKYFPTLCSSLYIQRGDNVEEYTRVVNREEKNIYDIYERGSDEYKNKFEVKTYEYKSKEEYDLCLNQKT